MKLKRKQPALTPEPRLKTAEVVGRPETEEGSSFDPGRDLNEEDWIGMKSELELTGGRHLFNFSIAATELAIIFPNRKDELSLDVKTFSKMQSELQNARGSSWSSFSYIAMALAIIYPERKAELTLDDEAFQGIVTGMEDSRSEPNWWAYSISALHLAVLFPERKAELSLDDEAFEGMRDLMEDMSSPPRGRWHNASSLAMRLTILFPERKAELNLNAETLSEIRAELDRARALTNFWEARRIAMDLVILSADRVEISDREGLKLTPPKPPLAAEESLPPRSAL